MNAHKPKWRFDLLSLRPIKWFATRRWFQFAVTLPGFAIFFILMVAGLFGSPVGNGNASTLVVWIAWWAALVIVLVPVFGRLWCAICPMPLTGEWLQRGAVTLKREKGFGLMRRWPRKLDNMWLQNFTFLIFASLIGVLTTRPFFTGAMLLLLVLVLPTFFSLLFERRVWCRYVCPVSGFIGLYSIPAMVEVRVKDQDVCLTHLGKECYRGSEAGYGCPWFEFPQNLDRNAFCGMCMECVKTCPKNNIAVNLRAGGEEDLTRDPWHGIKPRGLDESFRLFMMSSLSVVYALVLVGPYGWLKDTANVLGGATFKSAISSSGNLLQTFSVPRYLEFLGLMSAVALVITPAVFFAFAWVSKALSRSRTLTAKRVLIEFSYSLVPLSLMSWIALSLYILLTNWSFIYASVSDPFGWGWNLFGTSGYPWTPTLPGWFPLVQGGILLAGLFFSLRVAHRVATKLVPDRPSAVRVYAPMAVLLTGLCVLYMGLWLDGFFWGWF